MNKARKIYNDRSSFRIWDLVFAFLIDQMYPFLYREVKKKALSLCVW